MYKILIVEDERTIANAIEQHLSKWGFEVKQVTDFGRVLGLTPRQDSEPFLRSW